MPRTISAHRVATLLGDAPRRPPAYASVADALRLLIDDGRIPAGTRLPSERSLAEALACSRTTITRAYATLTERGFAEARHGSGTLTLLPDAATRDGRGALVPGDPSSPGAIDLTCAVLPPPHQVHGAYESALNEWPQYLSGSGYYPLGVPALREVIAQRYTDRGLPTSADEVMITSGAVGAHALVARAHLARGARVLVDSPTYPNGLAALRADGARPVAVPLDDDGWDLSSWESAVERSGASAALLLPDFQNPTGALMSDEDRGRVGRALRRSEVLGIVDETLAETSLDDTPMPAPFAAHHRDTVTIGGASKSHWSGLRVGWVRAPARLMSALASARTALDLGSPVLEQLALIELMAQDETIAAERSRTARTRRDVLADALAEHLPEWRFRVPRGGLCLWVTLPEPVSTPFVIAAEREGVLLAPGPRFAAESGLERHLRVPFTAPEATLVAAAAAMASAWGQLDRRDRGSRAAGWPLIA
ncbi:MAG: PLP-dependent aminotransferase family protein [Janibacter sp.]